MAGVRYLELSTGSAAHDLALDEALLDVCEESGTGEELLRIWESAELAVVLGCGSRLLEETHAETCRAVGVPILRRISGGSAVVIGPGCLMYSLLLCLEKHPELTGPLQIHSWVLEKLAAGLGQKLTGIRREGISDLAFGEKKVSGNSLRLKRRYVLYHGTLLYQFPLEQIGQLLRMPPRQPPWRRAREHLEFVTNLPLSRDELLVSLRKIWNATQPWDDVPQQLVEALVAEKYSRAEWNERR